MTSTAPFGTRWARFGSVYSAGNNDGHTMLTRVGWRPDGSSRGILVAHAAAQLHYNALPGTWPGAYRLAYRWPLMVADAGDPTQGSASTTSAILNWANDNALSRLSDAYTWLTTTPVSTNGDFGSTGGGGCKTGKVGLLGASMGAIQVLAWARQHPTSVACVGVVIPAINLKDIHDNNKNSYAASVEASAGGVGNLTTAYYNVHSPLDGNPADYTAFPIRIYAHSDDGIAATTAVCQTWAASVNAAGGNATVFDLGTGGHDVIPDTYSDDILGFFSTNMPA